MGTAVPSVFVSTGDLESAKSAILVIYANQAEDGQFPKAGPPNAIYRSDNKYQCILLWPAKLIATAYHLWHLEGTYNYVFYSGDTAFIADVWPQFIKGLNRTLGLVSSSGLLNVTGDQDWGRFTYSTERASANILLYRSLTAGAAIASWLPDSVASDKLAAVYRRQSKALKTAILEQLWDNKVGAFIDSSDSDLYPQDANALAVAYGVVDPDSRQARRVSNYLESNWTPILPASPELPGNSSPFISSIELDAHFRAGQPDRVLDLTKSLWGWYLNHENGTQSTTTEGFNVDSSWEYRRQRSYVEGTPYMSHAHGWSSGPTSTLTEHMLGLRGCPRPPWCIPLHFDILPLDRDLC
ncbi:Six-hairpin glycosidase-like protein [Aspergillus crustosus]